MERKRKYDRLPAELEQRILQDRQAHAENPFACRDEDCLRRQKLEKETLTSSQIHRTNMRKNLLKRLLRSSQLETR